jgi:hypothetical protein
LSIAAKYIMAVPFDRGLIRRHVNPAKKREPAVHEYCSLGPPV